LAFYFAVAPSYTSFALVVYSSEHFYYSASYINLWAAYSFFRLLIKSSILPFILLITLVSTLLVSTLSATSPSTSYLKAFPIKAKEQMVNKTNKQLVFIFL